MVRHMSDGGPGKQQYMVNIYESKDTPEALVFTFVPKGLPGTHGTDERPQRVPQYIVLVQGNDGTMAFDWSRTPDDPGTARAELEHEARQRVKSRTRWIGMVTDLVVVVEQWGQELGWATRRIEKRLDDSQIGKHQVPALLMQEGTCRVMLEPVGRSAPGVEGVVDLYRLPAYDDIATLYYYGERWNLHYLFPGSSAASVREAAGVPLSKEALQRVLEELTQHAA